MRQVLFAAAFGFAALPSATALAADTDLPPTLIGSWAVDGQCADSDALAEIGKTTLALGGNEPRPAVFHADDSPAGNGAIHWAEEGNVDNFEWRESEDILAYNAQGYGMDIEPVIYQRCPQD